MGGSINPVDSCSPNPCTQLPSSVPTNFPNDSLVTCCYTTGDCIVCEQEHCDDSNGYAHPYAQSCSPNPCITGVPTGAPTASATLVESPTRAPIHFNCPSPSPTVLPTPSASCHTHEPTHCHLEPTHCYSHEPANCCHDQYAGDTCCYQHREQLGCDHMQTRCPYNDHMQTRCPYSDTWASCSAAYSRHNHCGNYCPVHTSDVCGDICGEHSECWKYRPSEYGSMGRNRNHYDV